MSNRSMPRTSQVEAETVGTGIMGGNGEFLVGTGRALVPKVSSLLLMIPQLPVSQLEGTGIMK